MWLGIVLLWAWVKWPLSPSYPVGPASTKLSLLKVWWSTLANNPRSINIEIQQYARIFYKQKKPIQLNSKVWSQNDEVCIMWCIVMHSSLKVAISLCHLAKCQVSRILINIHLKNTKKYYFKKHERKTFNVYTLLSQRWYSTFTLRPSLLLVDWTLRGQTSMSA